MSASAELEACFDEANGHLAVGDNPRSSVAVISAWLDDVAAPV